MKSPTGVKNIERKKEEKREMEREEKKPIVGVRRRLKAL